MKYVKTTGGVIDIFPYTLKQFRQDNPGVVLSPTTPIAQLEALGVFEVTVAPRPAGEVVAQNSVPDLIDGAWVLGWTARDFTSEEQLELLTLTKDNKMAELEDKVDDEIRRYIINNVLSGQKKAALVALRNSILNATTVAEVEAIDVKNGWG